MKRLLLGVLFLSGCYDFGLLSTPSTDGGTLDLTSGGQAVDGRLASVDAAGAADLATDGGAVDLASSLVEGGSGDLGPLVGDAAPSTSDLGRDLGGSLAIDLRGASTPDLHALPDLVAAADLLGAPIPDLLGAPIPDLLGTADLVAAPDLIAEPDLEGALDLSGGVAVVDLAMAARDLSANLDLSSPPDQTMVAAAPDLAMATAMPDLLAPPDLSRGAVTLPTGIFPQLLSTPSPRGTAGTLCAFDFDDDGVTDLVGGTNAMTFGALYLGTFGGVLQAPLDVQTNSGAKVFATGDFLPDGKLDLLAADPTQILMAGQYVDLLTNLGGNFNTPSSQTTYPAPSFLLSGDFDGDGNVDAVVGGGGSVEILVGDGTGSIATGPVSKDVGTDMTSLAKGDLDGDLVPDLVFADPFATPAGVVVLINDRTGKMTVQTLLPTPNASSEAVVIADLDSDGKNDVVASGAVVNVFMNMGGASFTALPAIVTDAPRGLLAVADFDQDGKLDLALGGDGDVEIYRGNGDGTFARIGAAYAAPLDDGLVAGDYNGDGKMDLACGDAAAGVSLLINLGGARFFGATHVHADPLPGVSITTPAVAVGDLDGDGLLDVCGARTGGTFEAMLQRADGSYSAPIKTTVGYDGDTAATAKLDADTKVDAVYVANGAGKLTVLLGNGDGTMRKGMTYTNAGRPTAPLLVDLSGDGKIDLLVANETGNNVSRYLGNGDGTFQAATTFAAHTTPYATAVADLNSDGKMDILVANNGSNDVSVLLGTGGGAFSAATQHAAATGPTGLAVGDFNLDGKPDVAVASCTDGVAVLVGNGAGGLGAATVTAVTGCAESVAVGDYDGDGKPDIAVLDTVGEAFELLLGKGDGTFRVGLRYFGTHSGAEIGAALQTADMNGDGKLDLFVSDGENATVFLNISP